MKQNSQLAWPGAEFPFVNGPCSSPDGSHQGVLFCQPHSHGCQAPHCKCGVCYEETGFTIFQGNCDVSQFSVLPEETVGLSDGERYFTIDRIYYLHPTTVRCSCAVWCHAWKLGFWLWEPSHVQSGHKVSSMQRYVLHRCIGKCVIHLLIYCLMLVFLLFYFISCLFILFFSWTNPCILVAGLKPTDIWLHSVLDFKTWVST